VAGKEGDLFLIRENKRGNPSHYIMAFSLREHFNDLKYEITPRR